MDDVKVVINAKNRNEWLEFHRDYANGKCEFCGREAQTKGHPRLEVHHIIPVASDLYGDHVVDIANGIVLCSFCHQKVHRTTYLDDFIDTYKRTVARDKEHKYMDGKRVASAEVIAKAEKVWQLEREIYLEATEDIERNEKLIHEALRNISERRHNVEKRFRKAKNAYRATVMLESGVLDE